MQGEEIAVDDIVDEMSDERIMTAFVRALRAYHVEFEWDDNQQPILPESFNPEDEVFQALFDEELKVLATDDLVRGLIAQGLIEVDGIDEDGYVGYVATEKGSGVLAAA